MTANCEGPKTVARIQFRRGTTAEWAGSDRILCAGEPGFDIEQGILRIGDAIHHWDDLIEIGESVRGTPGSIFFAGADGKASQNNNEFFWDDANGALKLFDKNYIPIFGAPFLTIGSANSINSASNFLGLTSDLYVYQTGDAKSIFGQYHRIRVAGTHTNSPIYGAYFYVDNRNSPFGVDAIGGSLTGVYIQCNAEEKVTDATGIIVSTIAGGSGSDGMVNLTAGWFSALGGHNAHESYVTAVKASFLTPNSGAPGSVDLAKMLWATCINRDLNTVADLRGLSLDTWSNTALGVITKSYGIYADASIDIGSTEKWFIYSLSTSPSLFSGPVRVPDEAYSPAFDGKLDAVTKNALWDVNESPYTGRGNLDYRRKVVHFADCMGSTGQWEGGLMFQHSASGTLNSGTVPDYTDYPDSLGIQLVGLGITGVRDCCIGHIDPNVSTSISRFGVLGRGIVKAKVRCGFVAQLSDATNTYTVYIGVSDAAMGTTPTRGCFFRYTHSVNGGKWQAVCMSDSVETAMDTGVLPVADKSLHIFEVNINALGTSVDFLIDGVVKATITTNIPTGGTRGVGFTYKLMKTAGTTSLIAMAIDYLRSEWNLTTPR